MGVYYYIIFRVELFTMLIASNRILCDIIGLGLVDSCGA